MLIWWNVTYPKQYQALQLLCNYLVTLQQQSLETLVLKEALHNEDNRLTRQQLNRHERVKSFNKPVVPSPLPMMTFSKWCR